MSKRIAIVGGGYTGTGLAKSLEGQADVTLIEQREAFTHAPAMIRAVVDPSLLDRALIPCDRLLKRGKLVHARAASVDQDGVTLEDGTHIPADIIVLATGSTYAAPFKASGPGMDRLRAANAAAHQAVKSASTIAIAGAGPVGTELAGEISAAMPDKKITLVSGQPRLFPGFPPSLGRALHAKLEAAGVEVITGTRAENLGSHTMPFFGTLTLSDGREIKADVIFPATGARAQSDLLASLPGAQPGTSGRVKTDAWMRPSTLPNVFAAGDAAQMGDAMTIVAITRQLPWLIRILRGVLAGKRVEDMKPYTPWKNAPILLPLGPHRGNSFLSVAVAGDWVTRTMKGRDLFLTKYTRALGRV